MTGLTNKETNEHIKKINDDLGGLDPLGDYQKALLERRNEFKKRLTPFLQTKVKGEWTKLENDIDSILNDPLNNNDLISSKDVAASIMKAVSDIYDPYIYTTTSLLFEGIHINIMGDYVELCTKCKLPCLELDDEQLCHNCRDEDKEDPDGIPSCWSCYGRIE